MARQHDPSGEPENAAGAAQSTVSGSSPVAVRRAVTMGGAAHDPGAALAPGGGQRGAASGTPAARASRSESGAAENESAAEPAAAPAAQGETAPPTTAGTPTTPATATRTTEATAAATAEPDAVAAASLTAGAGGVGGTGEAAGAPEAAPRNGPKKPMLAAAAIVGAILIGVPFLVSARGDDKDRGPERTENAAGTVLDGSGTSSSPDTYATESPSSSATPSKSASPKEKPVAPAVGKQSSAPAPQQSTKPAPEKKTKPRPKAKTNTAALLRQQANAASSRRNIVVKNAATGLCADVPNYGNGVPDGPVNQFPCNTTAADNQLWNLEVTDAGGGPGGASVFLIRNSKDGLCMDLPGYDPVGAGTKVTEFHCRDTSDNQLWWLDPSSGGTYLIRSVSSGNLCLSVQGGAGAGNDARLEIGPCDSNDRWTV